MYIIVVGCGSLGAGLAKELSIEGHDIVVIDRASSAFKQLGSEFNGFTVLGTGIDEDVLKKAGIEQADILVAVTSTDSVNIMAAQVAKYIFGVEKVIARVYNPEKNYVYKELGIDTICPNSISIDHVKNAVATRSLRVVSVLGYGDTELIEIDVPGKLVGRNIKDIQIPCKFKICSIRRGPETILPEDSMLLETGDMLLAVVRIDAIGTVRDIITGDEN